MSNKVSITDEKILADVHAVLREVHKSTAYAMGKTTTFFDKDAPKAVKEKLFLASNWIEYALELKNVKVGLDVKSQVHVYESSSEIILKLRAVIISLRTVRRTTSVSNAIKYIIEAIFILKVK